MTGPAGDDRPGAPSFSLLERQRLALSGDDGAVAVGRRLMALRMAFDLSAAQLGHACHTDARHILDAEAGTILPNASVMTYFSRKWRIPSEFLSEGRLIDLIPAAPFERRIFVQLSRF
jgi:hypothetical protein